MKAHLCLWWNKAVDLARGGLGDSTVDSWPRSSFLVLNQRDTPSNLFLALDEKKKVLPQHFAILHYRKDIAAGVCAPRGCFRPIFSFVFRALLSYAQFLCHPLRLLFSHLPIFPLFPLGLLWSCLTATRVVCMYAFFLMFKWNWYTECAMWALLILSLWGEDTSCSSGKPILGRIN